MTGNDMVIPLKSMISFVAGMGVLEAVFIQALYLSLGALLSDEPSRCTFDETVKKLTGFTAAPKILTKKQHLKYVPRDEPSWFDYFLDFKKLEWIPWKKAVPEYVHSEPDAVKFNDILVPTVESTRLTWILKLINEVGTNPFTLTLFNYHENNYYCYFFSVLLQECDIQKGK